MPLDTVLALLIAERDKINRAIEVLQGGTKRRGRPPKALSAPAEVKPQRKTRTFSAAQRKAASERMRKMWEARRKAKG